MASLEDRTMTKKKKLLILFTGGTFGMQPRPGATHELSVVHSSEAVIREWIFKQIPELKDFSAEFRLLLNSDSCQFASHEWRAIVNAIENAQKNYSGIVVLHGTDTLAYSSSAVALSFGNRLQVPVIFTGAQRPLSLLRNDARSNLIESCEVALTAPKALQNRCLVVFNHTVFLGSRIRKVSATQFDAYESPCYPILGELGAQVTWTKDAIRSLPKLKRSAVTIPSSKKNVRLLTLQTTPGFPSISHLMMKSLNLDGILLNLFPAGTAPTEQTGFSQFLDAASATKTPLFLVTNHKGRPQDLHAYSASRSLLKRSSIYYGHDMTLEAAYTKAFCLLGSKLSLKTFGKRAADEMIDS
jgi:L-asparaginase